MDATVLNLFEASPAVHALHKNTAKIKNINLTFLKFYLKFKLNFILWMLVFQIFSSL